MQTNLSPPPLQSGDRLLDLSELKRVYPKSTSGIYAEIRAGKFPAPVRIGPNRVAWIERQVLDHINLAIGAANDAHAASSPRT